MVLLALMLLTGCGSPAADPPAVADTPFDSQPPPPPFRYLGEANVEQFSMPVGPVCFDAPLGPPDGEGYLVSQGFGGPRDHLGEDWRGPGVDGGLGDTVAAVCDGQVITARDYGVGGWGKVVRVVHRYGEEQWVESLYAHLERIDVEPGQRVARGERLGTLGDADGQTSPHLHLELRESMNLPLWHGYDREARGWIEPRAFIRAHRTDCPERRSTGGALHQGTTAQHAGPPVVEPAGQPAWTELEPGLELAVFRSPVPSTDGDSTITVLRVDPEHFEPVLLMASQTGTGEATAREWAQEHGLVAAINPSMFETDRRTSTFYMRVGDHDNNPAHHPRANAWLAFGPREPGLAPVRILDPSCDDVALRERYHTVIQSYRMRTCAGSTAWKPSARIWSHASLGVDVDGRLLLLHARSPWSTHDFTEIVAGLPIGLRSLQYAEGGPEASLYLRSAGLELERVGSYETGFFESDANQHAWELPNVLGVRRRVAATTAEPG